MGQRSGRNQVRKLVRRRGVVWGWHMKWRWAKVVQNFVIRSQLSKVRLPLGARQPLSSATALLAQGTGLSEQWPWWEGWKLCRASLSPRLIQLLHLLRNPPVLKGPADPESSVWHYLSRKLNSPWGPSWIGQWFSLWELNMTAGTSLVPAPVPKNAWLNHVGLSQRCLRQRRWQQCTTYIYLVMVSTLGPHTRHINSKQLETLLSRMQDSQ